LLLSSFYWDKKPFGHGFVLAKTLLMSGETHFNSVLALIREKLQVIFRPTILFSEINT